MREELKMEPLALEVSEFREKERASEEKYSR